VADIDPSLPDEGDERLDEAPLGAEPYDLGEAAPGGDEPDFDALVEGVAPVIGDGPEPEDDSFSSELDADELALTPEGEDLANPDLPDVEAEVSPDETEAEELVPDADETVPEAGDEAEADEAEASGEVAAFAASSRAGRPVRKAKQAAPVDEAQLDEATEEANEASSPRPVRRQLTQAPVKKGRPTKPQAEATKPAPKRTTPATFTKQSVGELKKVVWPSGDVTGQYFLVVLVFVLVLMTFVVGLDTFFGWGLTKWLGGS